MLRAHTLTIAIRRPAAEVYRFLVDPDNFGDWLQLGIAERRVEMGRPQLLFDMPEGRVRVELTAENSHFVLDYAVWFGTQLQRLVGVRVLANGDSCVLVHTAMQQPGVTTEAFDSEQAWLETDLLVLKSLLES
ncbi:SRPBCC family protein [Devosia sp. FKR38]|uniref:SRPBCC family protein n=1 Tax=Devosia sp. FKR38 TaxID=2562312 RepID=UPI0010BF82A9|nr:SRPBCC family protein [Devosia sp. FKR38]